MAKTKSELTDELGSALADSLNKKFKASGIKAAYFLEGDDDAPTIIKEWVSMGNDIADIAISNQKYGGLPVGRIVEVTGQEQSGKSLFAAHVIAETQKKGGLGVYIDTENAMHKQFFASVGIDMEKMVYAQLEMIEDVFETIETIVEKVRSSSKDRLVTIVVDSVAGASTKSEMQADFDRDGYATDKALIISKALRKISNLIGRERILLVFTNQLRHKMNAPAFSDPWTSPGGKGLPFHSSVRIRLNDAGKIKDSNGVVIGHKVKMKIVKNKVGPPNREVEYEAYYDSGIDNYSAWLKPMKSFGIVKQSGAWYEWTSEETGEVIKFQAKDFVEKIVSVETYRDEIYNQIADNLIMVYKQLEAPRIDDVELTDEVYEEE